MQIQWIQYGDLKQSKYLLILNLGTRNHRISALICNKVPNTEVTLIKEATTLLSTVSLADIIAWLKQTCPNSYRLAYREFTASKVRIVQKY